MPLPIKNLHSIDESGPYIVEINVDVPLKTAPPSVPGDPRLIRANVYRPKAQGKYPVLVTYGPYGKDIHYKDFHAKSFSEVNQNHHSGHSAWETPDPAFWTGNGYAVVRADERGSGQSPGKLDTMSRETSEAFFDVVEWAADQEWSSGKVGLLGISYYAGSQWRVAARRPKGLAAIVPWEGMSDYYRDRVRHGGILSNTFISFWWNRQVVSNQYGLGGRTARNWGLDSLEGDLPESELVANRQDQTIDTAKYKFRDEEYYSSKDFKPEDIEVPVLSVANWGGILLHLRGNILGYMRAGSKFKYLRCITGRHDLPFYYDEEVEIQKSFLNAFLKGEDDLGWSVPGKLPAVDICLRKGSPAYNDAAAERAAFPRRVESEWPIKRTKYTDFHLTSSKKLTTATGSEKEEKVLQYEAPSGEISFRTAPFEEETEITGHPLARLSLSLSSTDGSAPTDLDVFVTMRHYDSKGEEIYYTGTTGDPVPVVKGWLRLSLRATDPSAPEHTSYLPHRQYRSKDVQSVALDTVYTVDVEIWPTNVIIAKGNTLELQVASCDTQGSGLFNHTHEEDRMESKFKGFNNLHLGGEWDNYLRLPVIPEKE